MTMTFFTAFIAVAACMVIGELVSHFTKAWIPSVFVTAVCFLIGYWTFFPADMVSTSVMIPLGSTIGMYWCLAHMGTIINIKQLIQQWKVIVVCLLGLAGMCAFCWLICRPIIGQDYVVAGLPPLTGGIVAATTMQSAYAKLATQAAEMGYDVAVITRLERAALFAIVMYCMQGFAGYPLTAIMLKLEGNRLIKDFREGKVKIAEKAEKDLTTDGNFASQNKARKKLIPEIPASLNSTAMILLKLTIVGWIASKIGAATGISGAVWALLVAIVCTELGFLDVDSLGKARSYGVIMFALMSFIFDGLNKATPEDIVAVIGPMILLIIIGVAGMALLCFLGSKVLRMTFPMAFATALTALYGFPPNAIITENTCDAIAETPEEKDYLMSHMFPQMIVGGFTTVTITSVLIAGTFASTLAVLPPM